MAYYRVEPFGHDIGFSLLATVCSILANVHRKKGAKAVKTSDFYSRMTLASHKQSAEEMKSILMGLVGATKDVKPPKAKVRDKRNG